MVGNYNTRHRKKTIWRQTNLIANAITPPLRRGPAYSEEEEQKHKEKKMKYKFDIEITCPATSEWNCVAIKPPDLIELIAIDDLDTRQQAQGKNHKHV